LGPLEKEWAFLRACASPASPREQIVTRLSAGLDWNVLPELAEEHGILGIVAVRLQELSYEHVPLAVREKFQERMKAQSLFTLSMMAELYRIVDDFAQAGIEALLVKGPLISFLAYGDLSVRSFVDLDLLVRDRDILRAFQRMTAMGFNASVPESAVRAGRIPGEYLFKRAGTMRLVELHTERSFRYYPRRMRMEDLYARQRRVPLDGREMPALSIEDELLLNCIHGAKHFWERLIWVADVTALVARHSNIDWARVRQAARDVGAERMLHIGLELGETILGAQLPPEMVAEVAQDAAAKELCHQAARWMPQAGLAPPALHERALFRIGTGGGGAAGAAYLMRLSLSPTEEDWTEGGEELRSWLWDAARRPFRLMRKYGPGG
jgi:hypothetical protein